MNNKPHVLILSAGAVASDMVSIFGEIPSGMIPIKQKPALHWIIDGLVRDHFKKITISVGFKKEIIQNYVSNLNFPGVEISCLEVDWKKSPGSSIRQISRDISIDNGLLVVLGDTLLFDQIDLSGDMVVSSKDYLFPDQYSSVSKDESGAIGVLKEKSDLKNEQDEALVGMYFFKDTILLKKILNDFSMSDIQISQILGNYHQQKKIKVITSETWLDLGHLDKYYHSKVALSQSRYFNTLEYDSLLGLITKRSANKEKFRDEILWYENLPVTLKSLAPRIVDYNIGTNPFVKMEYYSYPTLADLFLYGNHSSRLWDQIFTRLFKVISLFQNYKAVIPEADYRDMYIVKTQERVKDAIEQSPVLRKLFTSNEIEINNKIFKGYVAIEPLVNNYCEKIIKDKDENTCLIHGDLCFSNILFDVASGIFRFIDPRGRWGSSPYGDFRYDLAKLRHSISGRYDFIVNDQFDLHTHGANIEFYIRDSELHHEISRKFDNNLKTRYNLNDIIFIEGLLFISMIPLHKDNLDRQVAMFATGIELLNNALLNLEEQK